MRRTERGPRECSSAHTSEGFRVSRSVFYRDRDGFFRCAEHPFSSSGPWLPVIIAWLLAAL